jgi:hypothetical protein
VSSLRLPSRSNQDLVVLLDHDIAMDGFHVFSITRNGHGLVYRLARAMTAVDPSNVPRSTQVVTKVFMMCP